MNIVFHHLNHSLCDLVLHYAVNSLEEHNDRWDPVIISTKMFDGYFHAGSKPAYISRWELLLPIRSPLPMSLQITCLEHILSCCLCLGIGHFLCIFVLVLVSWWICKTRTLLEMQGYAQPYLSISSTFKCVSYLKWYDLWSCLQTSHDGSSLSSWSVLCSATWYILRDLFFTFSYRYIVCQHI